MQRVQQKGNPIFLQGHEFVLLESLVASSCVHLAIWFLVCLTNCILPMSTNSEWDHYQGFIFQFCDVAALVIIDEELAKFAEQSRNFWESCYILATYCLNMVISEELNSLKYGNFGVFFPQKFFVWNTGLLFLCHSVAKIHPKKYWITCQPRACC